MVFVPKQRVVEPAFKVGAGGLCFFVIVPEVVFLQPLPSVTVNVYVPGPTFTRSGVVCTGLLLQEYVNVGAPVAVTPFNDPSFVSQDDGVFTSPLTFRAGNVFTVTVVLADVVLHAETGCFTVTVYTPDVPTLMDFVVLFPGLHK